MRARPVSIIPIPGMPVVKKGDDLASLIVNAARAAKLTLRDSDVLVITQKVLSKAEGQTRRLADVTVGKRAATLARRLRKDSRVMQVVLSEAKRIVRMGHGVIITETKHGFVCANSGVDQSNIETGFVTLLPENSDRSAKRIRDAIGEKTHKRVAVVITDTFGRPWREGQVTSPSVVPESSPREIMRALSIPSAMR